MYNIKIDAIGPGVHALCKCARTEINYYELRSRNIVSCILSSHLSAIIHAKPAKFYSAEQLSSLSQLPDGTSN